MCRLNRALIETLARDGQIGVQAITSATPWRAVALGPFGCVIGRLSAAASEV
jgi:hypothetical protein